MNTGTAPRQGGKVIKTLTNIRFIRTPDSPRPAPQEQSPKDLMRETQKQASEAYVHRDHEPAATVQTRPPPRRRTNRRAVTPDPDTEALIAWFHATRERLPAEPYQLTAWQRIVNPQRFYDALTMDIAAYPHGPRSHVIGEDLRHLRQYVERAG